MSGRISEHSKRHLGVWFKLTFRRQQLALSSILLNLLLILEVNLSLSN